MGSEKLLTAKVAKATRRTPRDLDYLGDIGDRLRMTMEVAVVALLAKSRFLAFASE